MDHCKPTQTASGAPEAVVEPPSEGIPDREREGTRILARLAVQLEAVFEPDRAHGSLVVEAETRTGPEPREAHAFRIGPHVSDVEEERHLEAAGDGNAPFGVREEREKRAPAHPPPPPTLAHRSGARACAPRGRTPEGSRSRRCGPRRRGASSRRADTEPPEAAPSGSSRRPRETETRT